MVFDKSINAYVVKKIIMGTSIKNNFVWLNEYNIGHDTVDQQHQYLFNLANLIVNPYNDQQKTYHNVVALYQYVREHFRNEELLYLL